MSYTEDANFVEYDKGRNNNSDLFEGYLNKNEEISYHVLNIKLESKDFYWSYGLDDLRG